MSVPATRRPAGTPTGGQFAASARTEADVDLMDEPKASVRPPTPPTPPTNRAPVTAPPVTAAPAKVVDPVQDFLDSSPVRVDPLTPEEFFWRGDEDGGSLATLAEQRFTSVSENRDGTYDWAAGQREHDGVDAEYGIATTFEDAQAQAEQSLREHYPPTPPMSPEQSAQWGLPPDPRWIAPGEAAGEAASA